MERALAADIRMRASSKPSENTDDNTQSTENVEALIQVSVKLNNKKQKKQNSIVSIQFETEEKDKDKDAKKRKKRDTKQNKQIVQLPESPNDRGIVIEEISTPNLTHSQPSPVICEIQTGTNKSPASLSDSSNRTNSPPTKAGELLQQKPSIVKKINQESAVNDLIYKNEARDTELEIKDDCVSETNKTSKSKLSKVSMESKKMSSKCENNKSEMSVSIPEEQHIESQKSILKNTESRDLKKRKNKSKKCDRSNEFSKRDSSQMDKCVTGKISSKHREEEISYKKSSKEERQIVNIPSSRHRDYGPSQKESNVERSCLKNKHSAGKIDKQVTSKKSGRHREEEIRNKKSSKEERQIVNTYSSRHGDVEPSQKDSNVKKSCLKSKQSASQIDERVTGNKSSGHREEEINNKKSSKEERQIVNKHSSRHEDIEPSQKETNVEKTCLRSKYSSKHKDRSNSEAVSNISIISKHSLQLPSHKSGRVRREASKPKIEKTESKCKTQKVENIDSQIDVVTAINVIPDATLNKKVTMNESPKVKVAVQEAVGIKISSSTSSIKSKKHKSEKHANNEGKIVNDKTAEEYQESRVLESKITSHKKDTETTAHQAAIPTARNLFEVQTNKATSIDSEKMLPVSSIVSVTNMVTIHHSKSPSKKCSHHRQKSLSRLESKKMSVIDDQVVEPNGNHQQQQDELDQAVSLNKGIIKKITLDEKSSSRSKHKKRSTAEHMKNVCDKISNKSSKNEDTKDDISLTGKHSQSQSKTKSVETDPRSKDHKKNVSNEKPINQTKCSSRLISNAINVETKIESKTSSKTQTSKLQTATSQKKLINDENLPKTQKDSKPIDQQKSLAMSPQESKKSIRYDDSYGSQNDGKSIEKYSHADIKSRKSNTSDKNQPNRHKEMHETMPTQQDVKEFIDQNEDSYSDVSEPKKKKKKRHSKRNKKKKRGDSQQQLVRLSQIISNSRENVKLNESEGEIPTSSKTTGRKYYNNDKQWSKDADATQTAGPQSENISQSKQQNKSDPRDRNQQLLMNALQVLGPNKAITNMETIEKTEVIVSTRIEKLDNPKKDSKFSLLSPSHYKIETDETSHVSTTTHLQMEDDPNTVQNPFSKCSDAFGKSSKFSDIKGNQKFFSRVDPSKCASSCKPDFHKPSTRISDKTFASEQPMPVYNTSKRSEPAETETTKNDTPMDLERPSIKDNDIEEYELSIHRTKHRKKRGKKSSKRLQVPSDSSDEEENTGTRSRSKRASKSPKRRKRSPRKKSKKRKQKKKRKDDDPSIYNESEMSPAHANAISINQTLRVHSLCNSSDNDAPDESHQKRSKHKTGKSKKKKGKPSAIYCHFTSLNSANN